MRKLQTKDSEVRYIRVFATYVSMLYSLLDGEETTGFRQLRPELIEKLDEFNQSPSMDSFHDLAICLVDHRLPNTPTPGPAYTGPVVESSSTTTLPQRWFRSSSTTPQNSIRCIFLESSRLAHYSGTTYFETV